MIPIQIIYISAILFYFSSILIHLLVLEKKIDYKLVNGGRSNNFVEQQKISKSSILILIVFFLFILSTLIFPNLRSTIVYLVIISIITLFWLLGTILQLIGTKFERRVVFWINLVGLVSHIYLILTYFE